MKPIIRSYLYVPADSGDRLARAGKRGADAVIADLEDSVAPARKTAARAAAAAWIAQGGGTGGFERWLRVNPSHQGIADLHSSFDPDSPAYAWPKRQERPRYRQRPTPSRTSNQDTAAR